MTPFVDENMSKRFVGERCSQDKYLEVQVGLIQLMLRGWIAL